MLLQVEKILGMLMQLLEKNRKNPMISPLLRRRPLRILRL